MYSSLREERRRQQGAGHTPEKQERMHHLSYRTVTPHNTLRHSCQYNINDTYLPLFFKNNPSKKRNTFPAHFSRMKSFACRYDAVLFDMDNTLHNLYAARFAAAEAVSVYKGVFGDLLFSLLNKDTPTLIPESLEAYFQENGLDGLAETLYLYDILETACIQPFAQLCELVHTLKESGVKVGLVSNADSKSTKLRLVELGLTESFDIVVNPETFGVKKPNPQVFEKTLAALGVPADRAVMIGDKLDRDVLPPRDAGLSSIHIWFCSLDPKDTVMCAETEEDVIQFLQW